MLAPVDGVFDQASVGECWGIPRSYWWKLDNYDRGNDCVDTSKNYHTVIRGRQPEDTLRQVIRIVTANIKLIALQQKQQDYSDAKEREQD